MDFLAIRGQMAITTPPAAKFSLPSAKEMGILSHLKFIKKDFVDISEFQPKYLKEFGGKKLKANHTN